MNEALTEALKELGQKYAQEVGNKHILIASLKDAEREIKELKEEINELRGSGESAEVEHGSSENSRDDNYYPTIATESSDDTANAERQLHQ